MAPGAGRRVPRDNDPFCMLRLNGSRRLAFVRDRRALAKVCSSGFDYIISAIQLYYPCHNGPPIHYSYLVRNEQYLLYIENTGLYSITNLDRKLLSRCPSAANNANSGE